MTMMGDYGLDGEYDEVHGGQQSAMMGAHEIIGALAEVIGAAQHRTARLPPKSSWRRGVMATGVNMPDEGMHPLPLSPQQNGGLFANSTNGGPTTITYQGQLQKPFRGERMFVNPSRTGPTATAGQLLAQFFVGVDLQQAEIFGVDIETIGGPGTFGSRMTLMQADPGILIRALVTIQTIPTAPDTNKLNTITLMGRIVH